MATNTNVQLFCLRVKHAERREHKLKYEYYKMEPSNKKIAYEDGAQ